MTTAARNTRDWTLEYLQKRLQEHGITLRISKPWGPEYRECGGVRLHGKHISGISYALRKDRGLSRKQYYFWLVDEAEKALRSRERQYKQQAAAKLYDALVSLRNMLGTGTDLSEANAAIEAATYAPEKAQAEQAAKEVAIS